MISLLTPPYPKNKLESTPTKNASTHVSAIFFCGKSRKTYRQTDARQKVIRKAQLSFHLRWTINIYRYCFIFFWKNMMHCDTLFLHNTRPHCMLVFRHWPALPFVQRPHWSACQTQTWCLGSVSLLCSQYQCGALASTDKVCQSAKPSQDKNVKIIILIKNVPFIFLCEILYLFMLCH